jgi:hypothetical protein
MDVNTQLQATAALPQRKRDSLGSIRLRAMSCISYVGVISTDKVVIMSHEGRDCGIYLKQLHLEGLRKSTMDRNHDSPRQTFDSDTSSSSPVHKVNRSTREKEPIPPKLLNDL